MDFSNSGKKEIVVGSEDFDIRVFQVKCHLKFYDNITESIDCTRTTLFGKILTVKPNET